LYITHCTVYYTDHSLVYQKQWEGKDKRENYYEILTLIVQNLVLKILFKHKFVLGFANHICQTNKLKLYRHYSVHSTLCTTQTRVQYTWNKPSKRTHGKMLLQLISRLCWISTLGKLYSIFFYTWLSLWIHTLLLQKFLFFINFLKKVPVI